MMDRDIDWRLDTQFGGGLDGVLAAGILLSSFFPFPRSRMMNEWGWDWVYNMGELQE